MSPWILPGVALLVACGASHAPPATRVAPATPDPLPGAHALEGAPACVQAMAATRRCFAAHMSGAAPSRHGQFSCPEASSWHRAGLRLDATTALLPSRMDHGWNEALDCAFVFAAPLTAEQRATLDAVTVKLGSADGKTDALARGTVELSHLYCLAELGVVEQLECEQPLPVLQ